MKIKKGTSAFSAVKKARWLISNIMLALALTCSMAVGDEWTVSTKGFQKDPIKDSEWQLCLVNKGDLVFLKSSALLPYDKRADSLLRDAIGQIMRSDNWTLPDNGLQLSVDVNLRRKWKDHAAKNGWYLSADFSTDPPIALITKERDKHSRWTFVKTDGPPADGFYCYLENENDQGKKAWLCLPDKGVIYKEGYELRKPILTFDKDKRTRLWFDERSL